jgi:hypothetical protein
MYGSIFVFVVGSGIPHPFDPSISHKQLRGTGREADKDFLEVETQDWPLPRALST